MTRINDDDVVITEDSLEAINTIGKLLMLLVRKRRARDVKL